MASLNQEEYLKSSLSSCCKVLREFKWLLDLYVLDFFVDNHWNKLPLSWQQCFGELDPQTLGHIQYGCHSNIMLPLSYMALLKTISYLCVSRKKVIITASDKNGNLSMITDNPKLKNLFLKHVKLKKRHEISLMAEVVKNVADSTECDAVVDFGSGLGHLIRVLAYKYGLRAAGIECQSQLTEEARKLDQELEYTASKYVINKYVNDSQRPVHYNMRLSTRKDLNEIPLPGGSDYYGLVGLHPCGDLGPLLLKHFVNCENVQFICLVGCCYMKLSSSGYPMSEFVKKLNCVLSYPSREIACHAMEDYYERLKQGQYENLKIHAYRAALEKVLVDMDPKLKHTQVRSIKHSNKMTFEKYCGMALDRVGVSWPGAELIARGERAAREWRRVVVLYSLRLVLAPLVETLILRDRMLYVVEHGFSCEIQPVFDPKISPRNHIMMAKRR